MVQHLIISQILKIIDWRISCPFMVGKSNHIVRLLSHTKSFIALFQLCQGILLSSHLIEVLNFRG